MSSRHFVNPTSGGYHIGINVGEAAGQTVAHMHIHGIPSYRNDTADSRRGVRRVKPDKQK